MVHSGDLAAVAGEFTGLGTAGAFFRTSGAYLARFFRRKTRIAIRLRGFSETEARSLEELYGSQSVEAENWIWNQHSVDSKDDTISKIAQRCQDFNSFTITDAGVHEEMEVELVHEKEVEREVERAPNAEPAPHDLHANVASFVATGNTSLCLEKGFRTAAAAFSGTSLVVPKDFNEVFQNIVVTDDFWRTIQLPSARSTGRMDNFMRSVDWVVTIASPQTSLMVLLSPYEVNQLLPKFRTSTAVKLHMFTPHSNLAVPSLEDLTFLSLPSDSSMFSLPGVLTLQLNLFSGSLYFRDYEPTKMFVVSYVFTSGTYQNTSGNPVSSMQTFSSWTPKRESSSEWVSWDSRRMRYHSSRT